MKQGFRNFVENFVEKHIDKILSNCYNVIHKFVKTNKREKENTYDM